jgi:hypothetical protein
VELRNRKTGLTRLSKKLSGVYARNGMLNKEQTEELEKIKAQITRGQAALAQAQAECQDV